MAVEMAFNLGFRVYFTKKNNKMTIKVHRFSGFVEKPSKYRF